MLKKQNKKSNEQQALLLRRAKIIQQVNSVTKEELLHCQYGEVQIEVLNGLLDRIRSCLNKGLIKDPADWGTVAMHIKHYAVKLAEGYQGDDDFRWQAFDDFCAGPDDDDYELDDLETELMYAQAEIESTQPEPVEA